MSERKGVALIGAGLLLLGGGWLAPRADSWMLNVVQWSVIALGVVLVFIGQGQLGEAPPADE